MYSVAVSASSRGALSYQLVSLVSGDAFSWVRFLAKSLRGAMVPSGLGRRGPQRRRLPAGLLLLGWSLRCLAMPSRGSGSSRSRCAGRWFPQVLAVNETRLIAVTVKYLKIVISLGSLTFLLAGG